MPLFFYDVAVQLMRPMTLPPTFIQRERNSRFKFCQFRRFGQRGLARSLRGLVRSFKRAVVTMRPKFFRVILAQNGRLQLAWAPGLYQGVPVQRPGGRPIGCP